MNIPGYIIEQELRQGPITTVYLGRQISLDRPVLIKTLNSRWINEKDLVKRFHREAQICAQLKHRNIVDIIDVSTDPDNTWLIMDYVDGMDLEAFIRNHHPIPIDLIVFILHEILQGLHYAHSKGVTHRDIKPANILIDQEGRVKIADFGLARADHLPDISMHGEIIGSPAYLSPEQAQAKKPDHRSDLFSLGITTLELAGVPSPFKADNLVATVQKLISLTPPPLTVSRADIPAWLSDLVTHLLKKKPEQRPESAGAVLALPGFQGMAAGESDLQHYLSGGQTGIDTIDTLAADTGQQRNLGPHLMATLFGGLLIFLTILSLIPDKYVRDVNADSQPTHETPLVDSVQTPTDSIISAPKEETQPLEEITVEEEPKIPSPPLSNMQAQKTTPQNIKPAAAASAPQPVEPQREDVQAANSGFGQLMITCVPWAEIYLNGNRLDVTPLKASLTIPAGPHQLELRHPDYPVINQRIDIQPNSADTLHFNFRADKGSLSIYVNPWADVFINGKHIGQTPLEEFELAAGNYRLRLVNPLHKVWEDTINVTSDQNTVKKIRLEKN